MKHVVVVYTSVAPKRNPATYKIRGIASGSGANYAGPHWQPFEEDSTETLRKAREDRTHYLSEHL